MTNAADVIGWVVEQEFYCTDCAPTNDETQGASPIFADSETDCFHHCAGCEGLIPENLTDTGWKWLIEEAEDFLLRRSGRPEIHAQWHEHAGSWGSDPKENRLMDLWGEALKDENLILTHKNMTGTIYQNWARFLRKRS